MMYSSHFDSDLTKRSGDGDCALLSTWYYTGDLAVQCIFLLGYLALFAASAVVGVKRRRLASKNVLFWVSWTFMFVFIFIQQAVTIYKIIAFGCTGSASYWQRAYISTVLSLVVRVFDVCIEIITITAIALMIAVALLRRTQPDRKIKTVALRILIGVLALFAVVYLIISGLRQYRLLWGVGRYYAIACTYVTLYFVVALVTCTFIGMSIRNAKQDVTLRGARSSIILLIVSLASYSFINMVMVFVLAFVYVRALDVRGYFASSILSDLSRFLAILSILLVSKSLFWSEPEEILGGDEAKMAHDEVSM